MLVELVSPSNWRTCSRSFFTGIKERGQPATSHIVEELNLGMWRRDGPFASGIEWRVARGLMACF